MIKTTFLAILVTLIRQQPRKNTFYLNHLFISFQFHVLNLFSSRFMIQYSIEDDDKIERELENVDITAKDKCVIQ